MKHAICVENLSKCYRLGKRAAQVYPTLREKIADGFAGAWHGLRHRLAGARNGTANGTKKAQSYWALEDVSFAVQPGEVVGIIGRNGAGKSTLLKILSRIVEPTRGRCEIRGRMASLLEVGTGFHPELTGRENIYLNGSIMGMCRKEIDRKFDEIVAFSEIEQFLDTPVKRYSSGMYVRLAFAVAAHLEPDILVIDEVLAVGDASFQKKCLNKMQDASYSGRTVLFVSHSMATIARLCQRAILLGQGRVLADDAASCVTRAYLQSGLGTSAAREWPELETAPGNDIVRLKAIRVRNQEGQIAESCDIRCPVRIEVEYVVLKGGHVLVPNLHFTNEEGLLAFIAAEHDPAWKRRPRPEGHYVSTVMIPGNLLAEGTLVVAAAISTMDPLIVHVHERDVVAFHIIDSLDGDSARGDYAGPMPGVFRPMLPWSTLQNRNGVPV